MPKEFIQPEAVAKPVGYTHVVRASGTSVYVAGQVALDAGGKLVGAGDLRAQTQQAFENLRRSLEAGGARFADLVKLTIFVVDYKPEHRLIVADVRNRFVAEAQPPASTLVGVQALALPELMIEVEGIAVIDS